MRRRQSAAHVRRLHLSAFLISKQSAAEMRRLTVSIQGETLQSAAITGDSGGGLERGMIIQLLTATWLSLPWLSKTQPRRLQSAVGLP